MDNIEEGSLAWAVVCAKAATPGTAVAVLLGAYERQRDLLLRAADRPVVLKEVVDCARCRGDSMKLDGALREIAGLEAELADANALCQQYADGWRALTHLKDTTRAALAEKESQLAAVVAAFEKEKKAEVFEDGVEADAHDMSKAEVYMAGREWALDRWGDALENLSQAPRDRDAALVKPLVEALEPFAHAFREPTEASQMITLYHLRVAFDAVALHASKEKPKQVWLPCVHGGLVDEGKKCLYCPV